MKATSQLRFVERLIPSPQHGEGINVKVRVLQQLWVSYWFPFRPVGEWRDVPLIEE